MRICKSWITGRVLLIVSLLGLIPGAGYAWQTNVSDIDPTTMLEVIREEPLTARFASDSPRVEPASPEQAADPYGVSLNTANGSASEATEGSDSPSAAREANPLPPIPSSASAGGGAGRAAESSPRLYSSNSGAGVRREPTSGVFVGSAANEDDIAVREVGDPTRMDGTARVAVQPSPRLNEPSATLEPSAAGPTANRPAEVWYRGRRVNQTTQPSASSAFQPAPVWYGRLPKSAASKNGVREAPASEDQTGNSEVQPSPALPAPQARLSASPSTTSRNGLPNSQVFPTGGQAASNVPQEGVRLSKSELDRAIELAEARKAGRDLRISSEASQLAVEEPRREASTSSWIAPLQSAANNGQEPSPLAYFTVALAFSGPLMLVFCLVFYLVAVLRPNHSTTIQTESREPRWAQNAPNVVMQPAWPQMMAPHWQSYPTPPWGTMGYPPMVAPPAVAAPAATAPAAVASPAPAAAAPALHEAPAAKIALAPHTVEIEPASPAVVETRVSEAPRRNVTPRRSGSASPATMEQGMIRGIFEDNLKIRTGSKGKSGPNAA